MSTRQIHVFVSHAWTYSEHYRTLANWIFDEKWSVGQASLNLRDYSVPKSDPIHNVGTDSQLKAALNDKISRSHVIVTPTGMYANYSKWIKKEIEGANHYGKPILAVNPYGQQRVSGFVADNAAKQISWNKKSVINGIWQLYRQ